MAKRVQYRQYGGPEVLRLEDFEPPAPADHQVLVRVRAAAVNPLDTELRNGELKLLSGRTFPRGHGIDFAGIVEATGRQVTRWRAGDEVFGGAPMKTAGAFGELVTADEGSVARKPGNVPFDQAAALPTPGLTAYQVLIRKGRLRAGQAVFVHGALGAVGRSAVQLALARGARVTGSVRAGAEAEARELGIDTTVGFDFDPAPLADRFDLVFDTAGTLPRGSAATMLATGGRHFDIKPTPGKFLRTALPGNFTVVVTRPVAEDLHEVAEAAESGVLKQRIGRTVPLARAIPALTEHETTRGPKGGRLIIAVN